MKQTHILATLITLCMILCTGCSNIPPDYETIGGTPVGTPYKLFE